MSRSLLSKYFYHESLMIIDTFIGSHKFLGRKKCIGNFAVATLSDNLDKLREFKLPKDIDPEDASSDIHLQYFLRSYSHSIIQKASVIQNEPDWTNLESPLFQIEDFGEYFLFGKDSIADVDTKQVTPKPILLLGNNITPDNLAKIPFYKYQHFYKYIQKNKGIEEALSIDNFKLYLEYYDIEIVPDQVQTPDDAINFFLNDKKKENVYVERGVVQFKDYYGTPEPTEMPFEIFFMTVFSGRIDKKSLGAPVPSVDKLLEKYSVLHVSQSYQVNNDLEYVILTLAKKHPRKPPTAMVATDGPVLNN